MKKVSIKIQIIIIIIVALIGFNMIKSLYHGELFLNNPRDKSFKIISSTSNKFFDQELKKFASNNGFNLSVDYYGDLEIVDILNNNSNLYDGVWISNSIWLYMLNNNYLVTDSKSIAINPVVFGIKKSKAEELGFINAAVSNRTILDAIEAGKLKYIMTSVTKTNTGATAYLGFLNSLAGSPEVLSLSMLQDESLINDMQAFFKGVERVSGDESYIENMFINGDYEAVINYESSLIKLNKELVSKGKEPLYLIYPEDGVAINDMPFGYVNNSQNKEEYFELIRDYLRSKDGSSKLENYGFRTWYGGTNKSSSNVFEKSWGIDTSKYLMPLKYPSKTVITEALNIYIESFRKPTHTVFCLDVSGSMYSNNGLIELKDAMEYILNSDLASVDKLQFSKNDKITIITFTNHVEDITSTYYGDNTQNLRSFVKTLKSSGGTNIYDSSIESLKILKEENKDNYTTTIILMTDGESNAGTYNDLANYYKMYNLDIPIYSITFGQSSESQLSDIASLTNAKIFDGKQGLKDAFKEVRSYN